MPRRLDEEVPARSARVSTSADEVAFTGARSGGVSYRWDFGDGTSSTEANPRHTYARVADHTATLTVTYSGSSVANGSKTTVKTTVVKK